MRQNYILIDYENVQPESVSVLNQENVKVFVFLGENQTKLPVSIVSVLQSMGERAEYVQISGKGSNALDFHIAYYIGKLVAAQPTACFHIVSKDTGFDPLIQYLKRNKTLAFRVKDVAELAFVKNAACRTPEDRAEVFAEKLRTSAANKPATVKTLTNSISSHFQKQLSAEDVAAVIKVLQGRKLVSVNENKVTYSL